MNPVIAATCFFEAFNTSSENLGYLLTTSVIPKPFDFGRPEKSSNSIDSSVEKISPRSGQQVPKQTDTELQENNVSHDNTLSV